MINVLIDSLPLRTGHSVRGVGMYTKRLIETFETEKEKYPDLNIKTEGSLTSFDIIHYPYFDLFFNTLPLIKPTKTVVTIHDVIPLLFPDNYPPGIKGEIRFILQKLSLKNVSMVITDSEASREDIVKYLGVNREKVKVVYLGPSLHPMKNVNEDRIRAKYHLPEKFVLFVGDVNHNKNIPNLVKACENAEIPVVVVGKQATATNIDRNHPENQDLVWLQDYYKKLTPNKQLILTGYVSEEELYSVYKLATVYCQTSLYEGFGLPVLDAMICGCPVISTDKGSLPEIGGEAILTVKSTGSNEITQALTRVMNNDKLRKNLIEKGFEQAKKFTWEKTVEEVVDVYRQTLVKE